MNFVKSITLSIRDLIKRDSVKHLGFIYSSRLITAVLRFVAAIVVARTLGPTKLGVLTIATVIMGISSKIIEMGLTTTMVRKIAFHISIGEEDEGISLFRNIYRFRFLVCILVLLIFYFLTPFLAELFLHDVSLITPLRLAIVGAFLFNLFFHVEGMLRALEKFKEIAILNITSHVVRTGFILLLAYHAILGVNSTMMINILQIFIGFVIASLIIPKKFYFRRIDKKYPLKKVFLYSGWMYLFSLLFMLFDRLDVLMLGYFRQAAEVGIYSVAFTMIRPLELLPETFNTVFLPKVSKFLNKDQIYRYFKDTLKVTSLVSIVGLVLIFIAEPLIVSFYGERYASSAKLFQILVGAFILLSMINPLSLVAHSLNKPQIFTFMAGINLVMNFTGNIIFIPKYGALGAAIVTLVSRVLGGAIGLLVLKYYIDRWAGLKEAENASAVCDESIPRQT